MVALDHWRARTRGWDTALLAASLALAIYFDPVLAALPLPAADAFRYWTWFPTWV